MDQSETKQTNRKINWDNAFVNFVFTLSVLSAATILSAVIHKQHSSSGTAACMIFILAVLIIARMTSGYKWGIIASFAGVIVVNFIFTYPFMELNFHLTGYPLIFITMLLVSVITSATSTQIKLHDRLMLESEREQVRANLLRAISHDIRTPLTSIIGSTSIMLDENNGLSEEQKRQLLLDVHEDGQWLIRVTENILSITRIDGDNEIVTNTELAEELIETAVRKFQKRHPDSLPIDIILPDEPVLVPMDIVLMEQVLLNLLENALIHGIGATHIEIRLAKSGEMAEFSVMDDGKCIPDSSMAELFDGTLKSDAASSKSGKRCMGIGLAVCKTIVNAHGGSIRAENLDDRSGVVFTFTLPQYKETTNENQR